MLDEIFGDYPQIKVIDYLLMNPFAELSKLQIAVGAEISRITLNKFIDDLTDKELVIKNTNSKYHLNLQSPIVVKLNRLLDELNKLKKDIELCKQKKAELEGQKKELDVQKEALKKQFEENGVTIDTLPLAIKRLDEELTAAAEDIANVIKEAKLQ